MFDINAIINEEIAAAEVTARYNTLQDVQFIIAKHPDRPHDALLAILDLISETNKAYFAHLGVTLG